MIPDVATLPEGRRFTLTRRFRATTAELWRLWTTAKGIESWWGPPGFGVTVQEIDLRPGGLLRYTMEARAPQMVAFMQANGMAVATPCTVTYREVSVERRLAYENLVDFVPGMAPYATAMAVEFRQDGAHAEMALTFQRMHDATWDERQRMGWEQELGKLEVVLTASHQA